MRRPSRLVRIGEQAENMVGVVNNRNIRREQPNFCHINKSIDNMTICRAIEKE